MVVKTIKSVISNSTKIFKGLCTPAKIEAVLGIVGIISVIIACLTNSSGSKLKVACSDAIPYIVVSSIMVYILNALCKGGAKFVSWIFVLTPLVLILISIFFINPPNKESFEDLDFDDEEMFDDDDEEMFDDDDDELFEEQESEQESEQEPEPEPEPEPEQDSKNEKKNKRIAKIKKNISKLEKRLERCSNERKEKIEKLIEKRQKKLDELENKIDNTNDENNETFIDFGRISF